MQDRFIKMVSWNVNGLRAVMKKDFTGILSAMDADIVAIQETKLQENQLTDDMRTIGDYSSFWSFSTVKKGYSGVAVYTRMKPVAVDTGIGIDEFDREGRILKLDFGRYLFFCVYFPNGQMNDERLDYKLRFTKAIFDHADACVKEGRALILCGDFNTAHNAIDLKNPKQNENYSGFLRIERDLMDDLVARGYVDTFRHLYPKTEKYSWWTYRFGARQRNIGWRIDYFFVTRNLVDRNHLADAFIDNDITGSDHCPVGILMTV